MGIRFRPADIHIMEVAHPVANASSEAAARAILGAVRGLSNDDLATALI